MVSFAARAISGLGSVVLLARSGGPRGARHLPVRTGAHRLLPYYFGLPSLLAREVARKPEDGRTWVEAGTLIALGAGACFTLLFTVGSRVVGAAPETAVAVSLASIGMAFDGVARVQFAAFWAWERMRLEAVVTVVQETAFLAGVAFVVWSGGGVTGALLAFCGSRALGAGIGWLIVAGHLGAFPVPRGTPQFIRSVLWRSTPFAVNDTLTLTYMRVDSVLLGFIKGPTAVGLYQAGTNLVLNLNVLARSLNHALYPRMSRAWPEQMRTFRTLARCLVPDDLPHRDTRRGGQLPARPRDHRLPLRAGVRPRGRHLPAARPRHPCADAREHASACPSWPPIVSGTACSRSRQPPGSTSC